MTTPKIPIIPYYKWEPEGVFHCHCRTNSYCVFLVMLRGDAVSVSLGDLDLNQKGYSHDPSTSTRDFI